MRILNFSPSKAATKSTQSKGATSKGGTKKAFSALTSPIGGFDTLINATAGVSTYLFLQEMDELALDQAKLHSLGSEVLSCLKNIRLSLLDGNLEEKDLIKLKQVLEANKMSSKFKELQDIINDLALRCEVELAKFQYYKTVTT